MNESKEIFWKIRWHSGIENILPGYEEKRTLQNIEEALNNRGFSVEVLSSPVLENTNVFSGNNETQEMWVVFDASGIPCAINLAEEGAKELAIMNYKCEWTALEHGGYTCERVWMSRNVANQTCKGK